jgi:hypothetical protein
LNLSDLESTGFDIRVVNHANAVLTKDFPDPLEELCNVLHDLRIGDVELIRSGGGESPITQRLRRTLSNLSWAKTKIFIEKIIDGTRTATITHEIDHVRVSDNGRIAFEIEWNNKDPFFDRDLENFQRLHSEGAISVGVIVTRGRSLQDDLQQIVKSCADRFEVHGFEDLQTLFNLRPTARQRRSVQDGGTNFVTDWSRMFVQDKFGRATTHWDKLMERIDRGVGNPCPLLLIGIPSSKVTRSLQQNF